MQHERMLVFICSPLRGDIHTNMVRAQEYCRQAVEEGANPIAPHLFYTQFLDDLDPSQRKLGMELGLQLLSKCDELWYYGTPTEGMLGEISYASALGIKQIKKESLPENRKLGA